LKPLKNHIITLLIVLITISLTGCAGDNKGVDASEIVDGSVNTGDGGLVSPNTSGSTDVCEENDEGECDESTNNTEATTLSTTNLDFGIYPLNEVGCQELTIPGGQSYEVEIDKSGTDAVADTYQFVILDASGNYSQSRVEGSGAVTFCYLRGEIGSHKGQFKLVLNANSSSSAHAYVITASGETLDALFTITSPTAGQIIHVNQNDGVDNTEGDYLLKVSGSVNMNLVSIFENGQDTDILIDADGVKYKTSFDGSGNFAETIGLPKTQGVYNIKFSIESIKDSTLSKSVSVVVAGTPNLEVEVRDSSGNKIDVADPTDTPNLVVGLKVTNLDSSGSDESEMPVTLFDITFNGQTLADEQVIWYDADTSRCVDEDDEDFAGFNTTLTYCISLKDITVVQSGINTISAKAKNSLGETSDQLEFILDYDKPRITISSPVQNELKDPNISTITISGTVKNFAPLIVSVDDNDSDNIPRPQGNDVGSYCQPQSDDDTTCPESSIKLWFNVSPSDDNPPIYIYPEYSDSYSSDNTINENNENISDDDESRGHCQTTTTTKIILDGDKANTTPRLS